MISVYVTWRMNEDHFFITQLDFEKLLDIPAKAYVEMAADIEYGFEERNPIVDGKSYELISIVYPNGNDLQFIY